MVENKKIPAIILGNGMSRLQFDLNYLNQKTITYGCNAIHRDFTPDYLIALDAPVVFEIIDANKHLKTKFFTQSQRRLENRLTKDPELRRTINFIPKSIKLSDSGNTMIRLACMNQHDTVYLVGFDYTVMPDQPNRYNNVYRDTPHYAPSTNMQINKANAKSWQLRLCETLRANPAITFKRVVGNQHSVITKETNYCEITPEQFKKEIDQL